MKDILGKWIMVTPGMMNEESVNMWMGNCKSQLTFTNSWFRTLTSFCQSVDPRFHRPWTLQATSYQSTLSKLPVVRIDPVLIQRAPELDGTGDLNSVVNVHHKDDSTEWDVENGNVPVRV